MKDSYSYSPEIGYTCTGTDGSLVIISKGKTKDEAFLNKHQTQLSKINTPYF